MEELLRNHKVKQVPDVVGLIQNHKLLGRFVVIDGELESSLVHRKGICAHNNQIIGVQIENAVRIAS